MLSGFHARQPSSFEEIVNSKERFFVFFPVQSAVNQNLVEVVSKGKVPDRIREFPLMRMPGLPDLEGKVRDWWLFDGEVERPVEKLTPELERLSIAEGWGLPLLVDRITEDWSPVNFGRQEKSSLKKNTSQKPGKRRIDYYMYFRDQAAAGTVFNLLQADGQIVEMRRAADSDWLILVSTFADAASTDFETIGHRLETLPTAHGGTYDGNEVAL